MRYHWGLGVGHVYTHEHQLTHPGFIWPGRSDFSSIPNPNDLHRTDPEEQVLPNRPAANAENNKDSDDECSEEEENDSEPNICDSSDSSDEDDEWIEDEDMELAYDEMYGEI